MLSHGDAGVAGADGRRECMYDLLVVAAHGILIAYLPGKGLGKGHHLFGILLLAHEAVVYLKSAGLYPAADCHDALAQFAEFGADMALEEQRLMIMLTGAGIAVAVIVMAVLTMARSMKEMKKMRSMENG